MKLLFEIYRILRELGIKVKDIIGVGKSIQKTGTKLFKENIDLKSLEQLYNKGKLSDKHKRMITEAAKGLRDTNAIQHRKFLVNIRQIKNAVFPQEADVIDIATRAKIPASGIEKLKTRIQLDKNVLPFKEGEARWILDKAFKEGVFEFKPAEIEMIKGGKGDIIELFRSYYGSNAVRNLPAEGSINASSKFFKELTYAVDDSGFFVNHPKFNKEAIDWKKTRELIKEFGDTIEGHPFTTQSELRGAMREKNWVSDAIKKGELKESVPPATAKIEGPFPRLDPENDSFIILDETGNKMGRYEGRVTIDKVTNKGITQWWDKWDVKNNKLITDKSKYKFSGAVDDKGVEIIGAEGVIEGGKINISEHIKFIKSKEPIEAMKEANKVIKREGRYKNITHEEADKILKDTDDHIFQRDVVPGEFDPEYASGGRIGYRDGTILPEPKPEEVYLDKRLEKLQRAKKTILDNPGAFVDKDGKFVGEALIESINNDIAQLRKEYVNIETVPGHATGGVSNLFRRR